MLADKAANRERAESIITDSGVLTVPHEDPENKCRSKTTFSANHNLLRVRLVPVLLAILHALLLPMLEGKGVCGS